MKHEQSRLEFVKQRRVNEAAHPGMVLEKISKAGPLTDSDIATIITKRLERLQALQRDIDEMARSNRPVPTPVAAPLLVKLNTEVELLEKVLEVDTSQGSDLSRLYWRMSKYFSPQHRALLDELEAVAVLRRRIEAVRFTSAHYAAVTTSK